MASKSFHTLGLDLDLSKVLSDTKAALKEIETMYRASAARMQAAGATPEQIRAAGAADVEKLRKQAKGKTLTPQEEKALSGVEKGVETMGRRIAPDLKTKEREKQARQQVDLGKERIAEIRRSIKRENQLKPHEDKIASSAARLAQLRDRRVAIEKAVLARARIGQTLDASELKGVPIRKIRAETRVDEEINKARDTEAYNKARIENEDQLAKLSAQDRLAKERRVRLEQSAYDRAKTRQIHEAEAANAVAQERGKLERRLRIATLSMGENLQQLEIEQDLTKLKAQTRNAEARLAAATEAEAKAMAGIVTPGEKPTTRFQRFQARHTGGVPERQQTLGGFMKTRAISSAGFALSGVGIYGAIAAMRELITESSELETQFSLIESMWNGMDSGVSGALGSFKELKGEILEISRTTATAADVTANVTRQLAGAFAIEGTPDFARAAEEATSALKIARTTGLPEQEITDSLTAVTIAFREQGVTFEQIGDLLVGLENEYGVLGTELIQFTADLAPLGAELGFTAEQLTALGAVAQQSSGRSGAVIAEQLGRIIPALADKSADLLQLFQSNVNTAGPIDELAQAFESADLDTVLSIIAGNFDKFTEAQRNALASMVGGRREAAVLFSILNDGQKTVEALGNTSFDDFAGDLEDRFGEVSSNVQFKLDELKRSFEEFGLALFEAGLADAIIAAASAFSVFFQAINPLLGILTTLNDALGGIPLQLLLIAGGLKAIGALDPSRRVGGMLTGVADRARTTREAVQTAAGTPLASARRGARRGARGAQQALLGGGAVIGQTVPSAKGLLGTVAGMAPVFLAFEALNAFMDNTAKQAELAQATADDARQRLDAAKALGPEAVARTREDLQREMEQQRTEDGKVFAEGRQNIVARSVNFIGGKGLNFLGGDGDAALRSAAGQKQDYQEIEEELARAQAEKYQDILNLVIENSDKEFIKALEGADLTQITANINANKDYKSDAVRQLIGEDNTISASDFNVDNIRALMEDAAGGNALSAAILKQLADFAGAESNAELLSAAQELAELEGVGGELPSIDVLQQQLDRGEITVASYVDQATGIAKKWREIAAGLNQGSEKTQEYIDRAVAALQSASAAAAGIFNEDVDIEDFLTGLVNPDQSPVQRAEQLAARLRQGRASGVSGEDLQSVARDLIQAEQDAFQARIDATENVEEAIRMAGEGTSLSKEGQMALARLRAASGTTGEQITVAANMLKMSADEVTDHVINGWDRFGRSAVETLHMLARASHRHAIVAANRAMATKVAGQTSIRAIEFAEQQRNNAVAEADAALAETEAALAGNAPKLFDETPSVIRGSAPNAPDPADEAEKKRREAMERELSFLSIAEARAGDDAVALARIAVDKAKVNLKYAEGTTEKNNALAAVMQADNMLRNAVMDRAMSTELAYLDLAAAQAGDDAVALAGIARRRAGVAAKYAKTIDERVSAQAQSVAADKALRDAQRQRAQDNALAALDVASAVAANDAVAAAHIAKERAQVAQRFARNHAERQQALAQMIEADREMASALFEIFESSSNVLIAQADASMDSVAGAQERLNVLNQRLANADQMGLGTAARNNLQAEIISQEAALRDASLAQEREMINFQLEMGQITEGQAINALQSLLAIPGLADKQIREIQMEIERMRSNLGADFKFNLPSQLALPTAYEVRRLGQSTGGTLAGGGYNDNRNIVVNVNAQTNADPQQIADAVVAVVGDPSRNGTVERRF